MADDERDIRRQLKLTLLKLQRLEDENASLRHQLHEANSRIDELIVELEVEQGTVPAALAMARPTAITTTTAAPNAAVAAMAAAASTPSVPRSMPTATTVMTPRTTPVNFSFGATRKGPHSVTIREPPSQ